MITIFKKDYCHFDACCSLNKLLSKSMGIGGLQGERRDPVNAEKEVLPCGNCGKVG